MSIVKKVIKDLFTEADNETFDLVRVGSLGTVGYYLFMMTKYILDSCGDFSIMQLSEGVSLVLASLGGGIGFKYRQETKAKKD